MFGFDWTILWSFRKQLGMGIVALLIGGYIMFLRYEIGSQADDIASLNNDIVTKNSQILEYSGRVKYLETRLQDFADAGAKAKANADYWRKSYEKQHQDVVNKLKGIDGWKPQTNEGDCDATKRLLRDYRGNANGLHS